MMRYTNKRAHQHNSRTRVRREWLRRSDERHAQVMSEFGAHVVKTISHRQLHQALYVENWRQGFYTEFNVKRVTSNQFLAMLAVARLKQYDPEQA